MTDALSTAKAAVRELQMVTNNWRTRRFAAVKARVAVLSVLCAVGVLTTPAQALQYNQGRYGITLEGFGNLAGGYASGDEEIDDDIAGFSFGELRLLALADTGHNLVIGPRVTYPASPAVKPTTRRALANAV